MCLCRECTGLAHLVRNEVKPTQWTWYDAGDGVWWVDGCIYLCLSLNLTLTYYLIYQWNPNRKVRSAHTNYFCTYKTFCMCRILHIQKSAHTICTYKYGTPDSPRHVSVRKTFLWRHGDMSRHFTTCCNIWWHVTTNVATCHRCCKSCRDKSATFTCRGDILCIKDVWYSQNSR